MYSYCPVIIVQMREERKWQKSWYFNLSRLQLLLCAPQQCGVSDAATVCRLFCLGFCFSAYIQALLTCWWKVLGIYSAWKAYWQILNKAEKLPLPPKNKSTFLFTVNINIVKAVKDRVPCCKGTNTTLSTVSFLSRKL